ncbi:hypothetical protein SB759_07940 [Pseudomonas sp. SIMBA_059]
MIADISDGFVLFKQFASTGFWAFLFIGGLLCAKKYFDLDGNWPYFAAGVIFLVLLVVPHGWRAVFGTDPRDFAYLMEARQMLPSVSLFKADFWGVLIGSVLGFLASLFVPSSRW